MGFPKELPCAVLMPALNGIEQVVPATVPIEYAADFPRTDAAPKQTVNNDDNKKMTVRAIQAFFIKYLLPSSAKLPIAGAQAPHNQEDYQHAGTDKRNRQ